MSEHNKFLPKARDCKKYTLFIDRDGVINQPIIDDYAKNPDEFIFCDGALDALKKLKRLFSRVILVTNQQGVGKCIMTSQDLENVHLKMYDSMKKANSNFDLILYAPYLKQDNHTWRKPNTGMLLKAKEYYPDIDFSKSIMVGDSPGDMALADQLDIIKVRILNDQFEFDNQDFTYSDLSSFVIALSNK
ncbi:MAG: HAD-IIIA family hydrolase [Bacteroidetes bacterium]|nr:HAD-IIIA family hydrolase [Bacteroidota bacterium]